MRPPSNRSADSSSARSSRARSCSTWRTSTRAGSTTRSTRYAPPVLVTHSFCRAIGDHPRGLTDEQLRALGEHGGLVGLAFDPDFLGQGSIDEALRHIDRIGALAGENAVSIGSDWGVAAMGELGTPESLVGLVDAVDTTYGSQLAEKFAFANAYDFLSAQLPLKA